MFTHLHVHTQMSLLDGETKINDLVTKVKDLGMNACAITDHGNMFGVVDFYKKCKEEDIKPIIGCEVYVSPYGTSRFDRSGQNTQDDSRYAHLILLAKNNLGYQNLCKIVSKGWTEGFYYKPRVDIEVLKQFHEGLVCTSACLAGSIPQALLNGNYNQALKIAKEYQEIFGKEDFYIEIQDHGIREQKMTNPDLIKIAKEIDAKIIAANDAHYLNKEDAKAHDVLLCIQTGKKVTDTNRMKFDGEEFYIKSEDEMRQLFPYCLEAIDNTNEIAEKCNVEFEFGKIKLPDYEIPSEFTDYLGYFKHLCEKGMIKRYGENCPKEYWDRLNYEIDIISKMGFIGYYLIVWDFINFAKTNDIPVGPGRGSGAGSIAAYAMEITNLDPMKYNLLFERFLNPERISMPDFDIDFCYNRRHEVIEYVTRKYGSERVSQIVTFGTMAAKNAIRDVGRAMDIPYSDTDRIAKMIPIELKMTIQKALLANPDLKSEYDNNPQIKELIDMALKLEGSPRHTSMHAAGVLIADKDITDYAPLMTSDGESVIQFPMTTLEELGLVKMDFLGLRTLTVIKDTVKAIKKNHGVDIDIDNIDIDAYPELYEMIVNENTIGVFQFESDGMTSMLKQMFYDIFRLKSAITDEDKRKLGYEFFERLIAGISLYRPGPMDYIPDYIAGIKDPESVKYDCPELEPILKKTYGVIVYQEQVQEICRELAGYSYGRADLIRRAMGKKKEYIMAAEKEIFLFGNKDKPDEDYVPGCIANGISQKAAETIWKKMSDFAKYAFNKSHAASYAVIAFQTAFLKKYYNEEFMAALLTSVIGNKDKLPQYCNSCQKTLGIDILTPDVNESSAGFATINKKIRFGLEAIKNVGGSITAEIIAERELNGPYNSLFNFATRLNGKGLNKSATESLIKSGAFDFTGYNRAELLDSYLAVLESAKIEANERSTGQISLFDFMGDNPETYKCPEVRKLPDLPEDIKLKYEREVTTLFISGHPLSKYSKAMSEGDCVTIREITDSINNNENRFKNRQQVNIGVIMFDVTRRLTKNGSSMLTCMVQDLDAEASMIAFSKTLENYDFLLKNEEVVLVKASIDMKDDDTVQFIANAVYTMPKNEDADEVFANFRKEVLPKSYKKNKPKYEKVSEPVVQKKKDSKYRPGLYLKMKERKMLTEYCDALKDNRGHTAVYIWCEEDKKIYFNPNLKVNINNCEQISRIKQLVGNIDCIKIY